MIKIIDTFKDFKGNFENNLKLSIDEKIELWEHTYKEYPELFTKLKDDYIHDGYDWVEIAKTLVFNKTEENFSKMLEAYNNLLFTLDLINEKAQNIFNIGFDINIVLYSGLGNSAGWIDTYDNKTAILYGIDKIAELGWQDLNSIKSLIAHEICHVVHFCIRKEENLIDNYENTYDYGIWRIYTEGFAQFYQFKLIDSIFDSRGESWINICDSNINKLKKLYLNSLNDSKIGVKYFFGDWHEVEGISDVGYYLGQKFIEQLTKKYSLYSIATLDFKTIESELIKFLKS